MPYKPVGADENGNFPPRVVAKLNAIFAPTVGGKVRRDKLREHPRTSTPDPNKVRAIAAASYLTTPTPDGSGNAVHPDVCFVPEGFGGYKWWMVYEPYPASNNALENPCVVVSNDGITWAAPPGLTNPVEPAPGVGYNSDGELVLDHNGTMYLFWRAVSGADEILWYRTSTDGVTWTPKVQSLVVSGAASSRGMLSPSITWNGTEWCLFYVDSVANPGPAIIKRRTSATLTGAWTAATNTTVTLPAGRTGQAQQAWHIDVVWTDGYFNALINTGSADVQGSGGANLVFAVSVDGVAWNASNRVLMHQAGNNTTWDNSPYRGSLVPLTNGRWRIYYSASGPTTSWHIGVIDTFEGIYYNDDRMLVGDTLTAGVPIAAIEARPTADIPLLAGRRSPSGSTSDLVALYDNTGAIARYVVRSNGGVKSGGYNGTKATDTGLGQWGGSEFQNGLHVATSGGNLYVGDANTGGGTGVVGVKNAATVPTTNSAVGGILYAEGGALKWRGSSGTVTVIAPA